MIWSAPCVVTPDPICINTGIDAVVAVDPLRVTVGTQRLGLTGNDVSQKLEKEFAVVAELATQQVAVSLLFAIPNVCFFCKIHMCYPTALLSVSSCMSWYAGLLVMHGSLCKSTPCSVAAACLTAAGASVDSCFV